MGSAGPRCGLPQDRPMEPRTTTAEDGETTMNRWMLPLLAALGAGSAQAALPEGIAGPWFNPSQSGHGLSISLADRGARGVVLWHVYDPDGAPLTLYVDAVVEGRDLVGPAYAPRGMRFAEFDPDDIQLPEWGTVRIRFTGCDNAVLSWEALDPAYADGQIDIQRLARIDSLDCVLPGENPIPAGLYLGSVDSGASGVPSSALGIVDHEGRLWGYSGELEAQGIRLSDVPTTTFISSVQPMAYLSTSTRPLGDASVAVTLQMVEPNWDFARGKRREIEGFWTLDGTNSGRFPASEPSLVRSVTWTPAPQSVARLVMPVDGAELAGTYTYRLRGQFFEFTRTLRIAEDGSACLGQASECEFRGHVSALEGEDGLLDFRLQRTDDLRFASYAGRGWIDESALGRRLVLIGDNGSNGLALVATRMEDAQ